MRSTLTTLFLFLSLSLTVSAQHVYSGCIYDADGEGLIGASILIKGTTTGTVSDIDGCYTLIGPDERATLQVSYTGFQTVEVEAEAGVADKIVLTADNTLDEVVVTGYGVPLIGADRTTSGYADRSYPISKASATAPVIGKSFNHPGPAAGQLTAGEVNDFGKWDMWDDISKEDLGMYRDGWKFYPEHRYTVQLIYPDGSPAANQQVQLKNESGGVIWAARTDNMGRAELWRGMDGNDDPQNKLYLTERPAKTFTEGLNTIVLDQPCVARSAVDVAFVVDATGSMGDEISYLSSELLNVMERAGDSLADQQLRTAAVFYRDTEEEYLTRSLDFQDDPARVKDFVARQSASGGGDAPEAVGAALRTALDSLNWNDNAVARLLFLVLDAPPHRDSAEVALLHRLTRVAAARGIRIIPVVCSGMDQSGEYLMRSLALATNGTYTFLTDDSGIGGHHLEPSTDAYEVEKLNDLLVRLIGQFGREQRCGTPAVTKVPVAGTETEVEWTAYPNPTSGPLTLQLPRAKGAVYLLDAFGKLLRRVEVDRRKLTLELGDLPAGAYLLRYVNQEEESSRWVIVEAR